MSYYTSLQYDLAGYISVNELKEYEYCPAIPWIHRYVGLRTQPTPSMESARERADASYKEEVAGKLGLPRPYRIEYPIRSRSLGLSGVIDVLAGDRRYYVLEVKAYRRPRARLRHFRIQLLAYALLVNTELGPVREAILYNGGEVIRVPVTKESLSRVRRILAGLRAALESEEPPQPNQPGQKCSYCWYKRICPARP